MQKLIPLDSEDRASLALSAIEGDFENDIVRRYVFSTPETAKIVNRIDCCGVDYTESLEAGIARVLEAYKTEHRFEYKEEHANVLHFLRGGLNFGIREALHRAYGWNAHNSTYMSSQRERDEAGRWFIREDSYRKSTMKPGSIVFCGDVVATGVTLEHGLETLTQIVLDQKASIRQFVFFTIGCHKAEKVLETMAEKWKKAFPDFEGVDLFYIEGKFHLADSKTPVRIKLPGTDLLRRDSLLMPEFIAAQEQFLPAALERCTIYDAGSRAFDIEEYKTDVIEYWEQVLAFAKEGTTALEYLEERYPEASEPLRTAATAASLIHLCEQQLVSLR